MSNGAVRARPAATWHLVIQGGAERSYMHSSVRESHRGNSTRGPRRTPLLVAFAAVMALAIGAVGGCAMGDDPVELATPAPAPSGTEPARDAGPCPRGQTSCETVCVDTSLDRANCGACGTTCDDGYVCSFGECRLSCPTGLDKCDGTCANTNTDRANCGACGSACEAGEVCSEGACALSCQASLTDCSGSCVDTKSDRAHCGACGETCRAGEVCSNGACALSCQSNLAACGGTCVNTQTDRQNCGSCANACAPGEVCSGGQCALSCQAELSACGGACVNTQTDRANCGACGKTCPAGEVCSGGECALSCQAGLSTCDGACVNQKTDRAHCGACDAACSSTQVCSNGACTCQPGQTACGTACVDLSTSSDHCGTCGTACVANQVCSAGTCVGLTDGNGAVGKPGLPKVAIVASGTGSMNDVKNKLTPLGAFSTIDTINATSPNPTPALSALKDYDAIAFFTYAGLTDPAAFGDVLAAYLESGGGVVAFSNAAWVLGIGNAPSSATVQGAYADKYALLPKEMPSKLDAKLGALLEPSSPLLAGVGRFDCTKLNSYTPCERIGGAPINGGVVVASWDDGAPFVLRRDFGGRKVVELNFFPGSSSSSGVWKPETADGAALIKNALTYVVPKVITSVPRLELGNVAVRTPSPAKKVTYKNTSTAPRTITSVTMTGAHIGDFTITPAVALPVTLAPGETLDVGVVFTPTGTGLRAATVSAAVDGFVAAVTTLLVGKGI